MLKIWNQWKDWMELSKQNWDENKIYFSAKVFKNKIEILTCSQTFCYLLMLIFSVYKYTVCPESSDPFYKVS